MSSRAKFLVSNANYTNALLASPSEVGSQRSASIGSANQVTSAPMQKVVDQRVCDRCIVKKVKCDMKQPACSRCLESESQCIYSVKKRKPGPVKGSKNARRRISKDISQEYNVSNASSPTSRRSSDVPVSQSHPWPSDTSVTTASLATTDAHPSSMFLQTMSPTGFASSSSSPAGIPPSLDTQRMLLDRFFLHIHPSIPLFHQQRLIARYEAGTISRHLLLTICVVAAKILGMSNSWDGSSLEDCTAYLLELNVIDGERAGKIPSLDNFRQACLLAFYAFHQYPGEESWMRIGNLTRKAYQCGLQQIDYRSADSHFDREMISAEDMEEWRYVWWCIYCMDSYSNVSAVTPFIIEAESIKTALVSTSLTGSTHDISALTPTRFLPDDTGMLWKVTKDVTTSDGEINFNMHILTTALIREAATIHRLRKQSTSKRIKSRLADLEDHFSAFRLALPVRYLSAARNAFADESSSEHHARLICVLHVQLAKMLTYFPHDPEDNLDDWLSRWQECLVCAQDVVAIVKQWDSQYFTATDPAICFIISHTLVLVHLHSCAPDVNLEFRVRMETYEDVLVLFLEQFASAWSLPRLLITSFDQFKKMMVAPLMPADIDRILKVSVGPVNYRWLNSLVMMPNFENLENLGRTYENFFSQEWDSNEWEALMPVQQV